MSSKKTSENSVNSNNPQAQNEELEAHSIQSPSKTEISPGKLNIQNIKKYREKIPVKIKNLVEYQQFYTCAHPECRLSKNWMYGSSIPGDHPFFNAEFAHIIAYQVDGPRGDINFDLSLRNHESNVVLLCPNHHSLIDNQPNLYTIEQIGKWKLECEQLVKEMKIKFIQELPPEQFKIACDEIHNKLPHSNNSKKNINISMPTPISKKLRINYLSETVQDDVLLSYTRIEDFTEILEQGNKENPGYIDYLKHTILQHYYKLKLEKLTGDSLFYGLIDYLSSSNRGVNYRLTLVTLITYFFEKCEVFESDTT